MQYINLHIPTHYLTDSICPSFLWKRKNTCNFRPKTWGRLSSEFFLLTPVLNSRWCNNSRFTEVSCCALPSSKVSLWGLFPPVFLVLGGILLFCFSNQVDCCFCSMSSNTKSTLRDEYLQQSQGWGTSHHLESNNWELHSFSSINSSYSLAQCIFQLKLELCWCSSGTIEKPSQNQNAFIIVFRQVVLIHDPKFFSKLIFRFSLSMWSVAS